VHRAWCPPRPFALSALRYTLNPLRTPRPLRSSISFERARLLRPDRHARGAARYSAAAEPDKNTVDRGIKEHRAITLHENRERWRCAGVDQRCHACGGRRETNSGCRIGLTDKKIHGNARASSVRRCGYVSGRPDINCCHGKGSGAVGSRDVHDTTAGGCQGDYVWSRAERRGEQKSVDSSERGRGSSRIFRCEAKCHVGGRKGGGRRQSNQVGLNLARCNIHRNILRPYHLVRRGVGGLESKVCR
jgi:hypothetical protein